jgi:hypothetical protein
MLRPLAELLGTVSIVNDLNLVFLKGFGQCRSVLSGFL